MRRSPNKTPGFSMVELLVVLAIIAVLIAIIVPAAIAVRRSSKSTECQNNLRQIYTAAVTRASENYGYVGLAGKISISESSTTLRQALQDSAGNRYRYYFATPTYLNSTEHLMPIKFVLLPYLGSRIPADTIRDVSAISLAQSSNALKCFQCPAAPTPASIEAPTDLVIVSGVAYSESAYGAIDYAFNGATTGFDSLVSDSKRRGRGKLVKGGNSSTRVFCGDMGPSVLAAWMPAIAAPQGLVSLNDVRIASPMIEVGSATLDLSRHRNRMNVIFDDGHIASCGRDSLSDCILAE